MEATLTLEVEADGLKPLFDVIYAVVLGSHHPVWVWLRADAVTRVEACGGGRFRLEVRYRAEAAAGLWGS